jgi:hypothetical protein
MINQYRMIRLYIQGDQKGSVHLMVTVPKKMLENILNIFSHKPDAGIEILAQFS